MAHTKGLVFSQSSGLAVAIVLAVRDCAAITGFLTDWAAMEPTADSQLTQLGKIAAASPAAASPAAASPAAASPAAAPNSS